MKLALALLLVSIAFITLGQFTSWDGDTKPKCPSCRRAGDWPGQPLVLADPDGVFRGSVFERTRVFVCQRDGTVFAAPWIGPVK